MALQGIPFSQARVRIQKCMKLGHYTYQCKNPRPYVARPSRTERLTKGLGIGDKRKSGDGPLIELPDEFRTKSVYREVLSQYPI